MGLSGFILIMGMFVFSVIIHEVAHALAAKKFGDNTAYLLGRITIDPIKHIDLMWTIIIPLIMYLSTNIIFGGAKPVPVNPHNFRNPRKDMMWVALAGPASNVVLAVLFAGAFRLSLILMPNAEGIAELLQVVLANLVLINMFLACFNMIPIPPLDGGRVLVGLLPFDLAKSVQKLEHYGMFILVALIMTGVTSVVFVAAQFIGISLLGR